MGAMTSFVLGGIVGGALVWLYQGEILRYVDDRTKRARTRAAETLASAAETLEAARSRIEAGLGGDGPRR